MVLQGPLAVCPSAFKRLPAVLNGATAVALGPGLRLAAVRPSAALVLQGMGGRPLREHERRGSGPRRRGGRG